MKIGQAARIAKGDDWVISRYQLYLRKRDLAAEGRELARIMDRPPRIRNGSWSASAAGTCGRARQFTFLGMSGLSPDDKSMNIFTNGDYVHLRHQVAGLVSGYITDVEVSVDHPELGLKGTMDGVLANGRGLELKSINSRGFSSVMSFGVKPEHKYQVHAYMLATGLEAFHVVYENKDTNTLKEIVVPRESQMIKAVRDELTELNEKTDAQELLPMLPECVLKEGKYRWCQYASTCPTAQWPDKPRIRRTSSSDAA